MEQTIKLEMTKKQAKDFEKILDATLAILNKMEKESPEHEARFDKNHQEFLKSIAETDKTMRQTSQRLAKWRDAMEK